MSSFLQEYKRQPKLFIDLPSQGKWYDDTVIKDGKSTGLAVFGMNAMDEIVFKTPDALFTGEATAQVIKSCIPDILDPWQIIGYDIDFILVALRIATYGETMPVASDCPTCGVTSESEINLNTILQHFDNYNTEFSFDLKEFTFHIKPLSYRTTTDFSMQFYQLERQMYQLSKIEVTNENQDELNKNQQEIHRLMNEINLTLAATHIAKVESNGLEENDPQIIKEFIINNDAEFYEKLRSSITDITISWNLPWIDIECSSDTCDNKYKTSLNVDYSSFFGANSLRSRNLILSP